MSKSERETWRRTKEMLGDEELTLGPYNTYNFRRTPRRILFNLAYYKFAAKMIGEQKSILELGCGEALGCPILSEFSTRYLGVDFDKDSIEWAKRNFADERRSFTADNFVGKSFGRFDGIASLDVVEHIEPTRDAEYWKTITQNLNPYGVAIVGTPSLNSQAYANEVTRSGHINLYDHERMIETAKKYFHHVFLFSANDELVHTGFYSMAHYFIIVGVQPKSPQLDSLNA